MANTQNPAREARAAGLGIPSFLTGDGPENSPETVRRLTATIAETCLMTGTCRTSIDKLLASGELESVYVGRRHLVTVKSILRRFGGGA